MQHIPFDYEKKGAFGLKVASYLLAGFSIPFAAAYFQLYVLGHNILCEPTLTGPLVQLQGRQDLRDSAWCAVTVNRLICIRATSLEIDRWWHASHRWSAHVLKKPFQVAYSKRSLLGLYRGRYRNRVSITLCLPRPLP